MSDYRGVALGGCHMCRIRQVPQVSDYKGVTCVALGRCHMCRIRRCHKCQIIKVSHVSD